VLIACSHEKRLLPAGQATKSDDLPTVLLSARSSGLLPESIFNCQILRRRAFTTSSKTAGCCAARADYKSDVYPTYFRGKELWKKRSQFSLAATFCRARSRNPSSCSHGPAPGPFWQARCLGEDAASTSSSEKRTNFLRLVVQPSTLSARRWSWLLHVGFLPFRRFQ